MGGLLLPEVSFLKPSYFRFLRFFSLFLLGISAVGLILVPNPLSTPETANHSPSPIPHTDVNPLGANFFLDREVELWKREQTLKMAKEAGIGWVKMLFSWDSIEPRNGQFWDDHYKVSTWEKYDQIVDLCQQYGLRIIARLDRAPDWAHQDNSLKAGPPADFDDYGDFVYAVVSRYKGRVQHYQIWNEPNIWPEWGDQPVDPEGYVQLLKIAYQRAKEADPNCLILSAPLAQTLEKTPHNLSELDYLDAMYKAGAKNYFDILSANGYGFDRSPSDPPDPEVLNFARVKLVRQVMERYGDAEKAVWLNEFGWNAAPEDYPPEKLYWRRVSEEQQAQYTYEGIELARSWGWIGVINLWYFRQVGDILSQESSAYYFRIVDVDFTPRLAYYRLQELSAGLKVASPGYHEETSPAVETEGRWMSLLQSDASGGVLITSDRPGDSLTFTFEGTDVDLLYQGNRLSGRLEISIDEGQPSKGEYVDLFIAEEGKGVLRQKVAGGLRPGRHTLKLTIASQNNPQSGGRWCAIDAFEVRNEPLLWPFYGLAGLMFLAIASLASSFFLGRSR